MKYKNEFFIISMAVCGLFFANTSDAALKPTGFPQTFQDTSFTQRMQTKKTGYEPYKDASAYVIPEFNETDEKFKDALCARDRAECCRRWPDYNNTTTKISCQPTITYELYGGKIEEASKSGCPDIYYTNRGATITCIPTRKHSLFVGWCTDAGLKNCAPTQTIAVGEKDDKHFWAKWQCVSPAIPRGDGQACECPNPNMNQDTCRCDGVGMMEEPGNSSNCVCTANYDPESNKEKTPLVARINNGKCECLDTTMDINTDCKTKLSCPDSANMDPKQNCACLPSGSKNIDNSCVCTDSDGNPDDNQKLVGSGASGHCECKDTQNMEKDKGRCKCKNGVDINEHPDCNPGSTPPAEAKYIIMQCRSIMAIDASASLKALKISSSSLNVKWDHVKDLLECQSGNAETISKCFYQCNSSGNTKYSTHYINDTLANFYPSEGLHEFCSGNTGSGHNNYFSEKDSPYSPKFYTLEEADKIFHAMMGRGDIQECRTYDWWGAKGGWNGGVGNFRTYWYMILFKYDEISRNVSYTGHIILYKS